MGTTDGGVKNSATFSVAEVVTNGPINQGDLKSLIKDHA